MAVFTSITDYEIQPILQQYPIGVFRSLKAISEGIENTNYFLDTQNGDLEQRWVLTVFENVEAQEVPYFCALTRQLYEQGLAVPAPVLKHNGDAVFDFKGKLGIIVPRFNGQPIRAPGPDECAQMGVWLARMHQSLLGFPDTRPLVRGLEWMTDYQSQLTGLISERDEKILSAGIERYAQCRERLMRCPQGVVHGDLFHDNVLFDQGRISGVIDFYNACHASLIYDLAVAVNDWAVDEQGAYIEQNEKAFLQAYQTVRPLNELEQGCWLFSLELAALRFWISRMASKHLGGYQAEAVSGDVMKDPDEMKRIMLNAQQRQISK